MTVSAGIDIGSSAIKLTILSEGAIVRCETAASTFDPRSRAKGLLENIGTDIPLTATGYGRDLMESIRPAMTISEIKAHALGARHLFPSCRSVVDVGGQDVKVLSLDPAGKISRFELNDRCSAGTGKFLEIMAGKLGCTLDEFGKAALSGKPGIDLNSQCTVFAESEIISLLNRGVSRDDIAYAIHRFAVLRIKTMYARVDAAGPAVLSGGCAENAALAALLRGTLDVELLFSEHSRYCGSIGCALHAAAEKERR